MRRGPGTFRILPAVGLLAAGLCTGASVPTPTETPPGNNSCVGLYDCLPGILLPTWLPQDPSPGDKAARAIVYFVAMVYMFLGMSIIADRFMASIEVITSQEREVVVKKPNGETFTTMVRVWNETVSNLTLMALGSSAPEILLSIIEVCGHNFEPGELGPATIVGSAAFNMFVIMAICISVVPDGEHRKIKHLRVFFVTAFWSIFAYVWLYLILSVFSPGEVQIWEAVVTFAFFPCLVLLAWVADRRLLMYRYLHKHYRADKRRNIVVQVTGSDSSSPKADVEMDGVSKASQDPPDSWPGWQQPEEETRRVVTGILKDLRQKHPEKEPEQLLEMANYQALLHQQKSRAFYRIHATRCMTGEGNILKRHAAEQTRRVLSVPLQAPEYPLHQGVSLSFQPARYQCFENCGWVHLTVVREGGREDLPVAVDYRTEDGTALAGADYEATRGTLRFGPGQSRLLLPVRIIDDDIYEQDEFFRVRLSSPRPDGQPGAVTGTGTPTSSTPTTAQVSLGTNSQATVTIFDDDHAGLFSFELCSQRVNESVGSMAVTIMRTSGSRGLVQLPYSTSPGTARPGEDYVEQNGMLVFQNDETLKNIEIQIIDDEEYEKNKNFFIELGEPVLVENKAEEMSDDVAKLGCPSLGETTKMEVIIEESYEFKSTVDKLMKKTNLALVVSSSSWREQFVNAVTVSAGEDDDDEGSSDDRLPSCFDYIMHFLTVFWKVLFAFVPPTEYMNGWACFVVSISLIGLLTALTGDLATQFGCTIGLKSSVTAIVFVALGTSVPDTFASKVAAIQDQYADASIGNVTGSNAVNVFLGIGVAWTIAAVYWAAQGKKFLVEPGNLAFSVTIFTICAFLAVATLMYRRRPEVGGELGGPRASKYFTSCLFIALWLAYIILSSLEAYCYIPGF